jgi:eukaryotic translation initiation factor 2C
MRYPSIIYGDNKKLDLYHQFKGKGRTGETPRWILSNCDFLESGPTVGTGVQIFLLTKSDTGVFQDTLKEALKTYNIGDAKKNSKVAVTQRIMSSFEAEPLRQALYDVKQRFSDLRKKIVVLLLPSPIISIYQLFKDLADREFGLQTLCVTESKIFAADGTIKNSVHQYLGNVMMKVNLKCEGINHSAGDSVDTFKQSLQDRLKDTMILGADVTHPSLASIDGCPSIAALVGSVDDRGGKFLGSMRLQNPERTDREVRRTVPTKSRCFG